MSMRVVLVRLSALGDIVHTWPLAEALKRHGIANHLAWLVESPLLALVDGHPAVDLAIPVRTRAWRRHPFVEQTRSEVRSTLRALRQETPEVCLDPQGVAKSALLTRLTGATRRIGFARPYRREFFAGLAYTECVSVPDRARHVVDWNLAFAAALGAPSPGSVSFPDGRWLLGGSPPERRSETAILLPGAGHPAKILAVDELVGIANGLRGQGLEVVVAWGPGERERAQSIARQGRASLSPPTSIPQLARLLAEATVVIGADTGPVHLAASLGTPTVGVHLVTDPVRNGPCGRFVAVVNGAAPGDGHRAAARTAMRRRPSAEEIVARAISLLDTGV